MKPKIIVLEGPDATGKSTQAQLLCERFRATLVVQPSKDNPVGFLRKEVKDNCDKYDPFGIQCLHTISHCGDMIHKLIGSLQNWVFDRSQISTYVYGKICGLTKHQNEVLRKIHEDLYSSVLTVRYDVHIVFLNASKKFRQEENDKFETTINWVDLADEYNRVHFKAEKKDLIFFNQFEKIHRVNTLGKSIETINDEIVNTVQGIE